MFKNIATQP